MKKLALAIIVSLLSACAGAPVPQADLCASQLSYQRGFRDGKLGTSSPAFEKFCQRSPEAMLQYHEGQTAALAQQPTYGPDLRGAPSTPPQPSWVCEVEASTKVFTGVGYSLEEAKRSARSSCGAHFRASACGQSECKQNL